MLFRTRVWHPNVNLESGKPCIDGLRETWKATSTIRDVLQYVRDLLADPNPSDSVNSAAASEMLESLEKFEKHAADETKTFATSS